MHYFAAKVTDGHLAAADFFDKNSRFLVKLSKYVIN